MSDILAWAPLAGFFVACVYAWVVTLARRSKLPIGRGDAAQAAGPYRTPFQRDADESLVFLVTDAGAGWVRRDRPTPKGVPLPAPAVEFKK